MAFDRRPLTAEARALVAQLVRMIEDHEARLGRRQRRRRQSVQVSLVDLVGRFAGELVAAVDGEERPLLPCHKNVTRLSELGIAYSVFDPVFDGLEGLGLIEVAVRGSHQRFDPVEPGAIEGAFTVADGAALGAGRGRTTRIQPTEAFLSLVRRSGIKRNSARRHFPRLRPPPPVLLRASSAWAYGEKRPGSLMSVRRGLQGPGLNQLRSEVEELNAFIQEVKIDGVEGIELTGWTRIFNQGDQSDFAWDRGGRLYARPGNANYQSLPSSQRGQLRINGEAVVEIDIRASHLSLVYALKGQSLASHVRVFDERGFSTEGDPYQVGDLPRAVVKTWVTITLGKGEPPRRWSPMAVQDLREQQGLDLTGYRAADVGSAVLDRHPVLRDLTRITWAKLQFIESQAIVATMLRLKRDHGIPALPVHDSLIIPQSAYHVADLLLHDELKEVAGQHPLPFKTSVPLSELPEPEKTPYRDFLKVSLWDF